MNSDSHWRLVFRDTNETKEELKKGFALLREMSREELQELVRKENQRMYQEEYSYYLKQAMLQLADKESK